MEFRVRMQQARMNLQGEGAEDDEKGMNGEDVGDAQC